MSDTPRTEVHVIATSQNVLFEQGEYVKAAFARKLERELNELKATTLCPVCAQNASRHMRLPAREFAHLVLKNPLAIGIPVYYSEWPTPDGRCV